MKLNVIKIASVPGTEAISITLYDTFDVNLVAFLMICQEFF